MVFCLSLDQALDEALPPGAGDGPVRIGYADDTFVDGTATQVAQAWPHIEASLAAAGHSIQPIKCHLWSARHSQRCPDDERALAGLAELFPLTHGNLRIMGTEAGAGYTTAVGSQLREAAASAEERAQAAVDLCSHIEELATAELGIPRLAAAWTLLTKSASRALDFDARLVDPVVLRPVTSALDIALRRAADTICGKNLSDGVWNQATLSGPLAGCALRLPSAVLEAAFWSSWEAHETAAEDFSRQIGRYSKHRPANVDAERVADDDLRKSGVNVR